MKVKTKKSHEIILKNGKPKAVILDIGEYQEILERLEDIKDLKTLEKMRKRPLRFRRFEEFLRGYKPSV
jgi:PHD/YefM family antitoxin component YafN of YafNO toxin-antitoxin module